VILVELWSNYARIKVELRSKFNLHSPILLPYFDQIVCQCVCHVVVVMVMGMMVVVVVGMLMVMVMVVVGLVMVMRATMLYNAGSANTNMTLYTETKIIRKVAQLASESISRGLWHCIAQQFEHTVQCSAKVETKNKNIKKQSEKTKTNKRQNKQQETKKKKQKVVPIVRSPTPPGHLNLRHTCRSITGNGEADYGAITPPSDRL
jgi:hypothetical protein